MTIKNNIQQILHSLRLRHINGIFAESSEDARNKILNLISKEYTVGMGDSTSIRQIGVKEALIKKGVKVLHAFDHKRVYKDYKEWEQLVVGSSICDVFLAGTNALTLDGRLVNVDGMGNRVAGMFWGHRMSIIVAGRNKIVKNLDEAFYRIRTIIAPTHVKIKAELSHLDSYNTPCAKTGKCVSPDGCRSADRRCNIFTIIEGKPRRTDMWVVVVNEDLGLGWDESWPKERISQIIENYKRFLWIQSPTVDKWMKGNV